MSSFSESYEAKPQKIEIPSIPLNLELSENVLIKIENGDYSFFDKRKIKRIKSFCSEVLGIVLEEEEVKKLPASDIIFF